MTELVLDASVVLKWFRTEGERHLERARSLRTAFEQGALIAVAPSLLYLEILNVAGRRWHWTEKALDELVAGLEGLGFELKEPSLARIAHWTARGLTAYDAVYVALAEAEALQLVTDDEVILAVAAEIATPLAEAGT